MVQDRKDYLREHKSKSEIIEYGIEGYTIAKHWKNDNKLQGVANWKSRKVLEKGKYSYLDDVIKLSKTKVSPTQYAGQEDWKVRTASVASHGHPHKDEFRKGARETLNSQIMKEAKAKGFPAPGHYNTVSQRISGYGAVKQTSPQMLMNGDCVVRGGLAPAAKYDTLGPLKLTRPTIFALKIRPDANKDKNPYKIVKSKDPDAGSYKAMEAFNKTQLPTTERKVFMSKNPKSSYIDHVVKKKKALPAPGHYKTESCYGRLSPSPIGLRIKRH